MSKVHKEKTYVEQFHQIWNTVLKAAGFVGVNVYPSDYRMNWVTYVLIGFIIMALSGNTYIIYVSVILNKDWSMLLLGVCYAGPAIQGIIKLYATVGNAGTLRFLRSEVVEMYSTYGSKSKLYQESIRSSISLVKRIKWILLALYTGTYLSLICIPLIYRIVFKKYIPILRFVIPGVDRDHIFGLLVHDVAHIVAMFFAGSGNFGSDFILFGNVAHITLLKNILKCKFEDLNETLRTNPRDPAKSMPMLRDILLWHQKLLNFVELTKNAYFGVIFVEIVTSVNTIICALVCFFLDVMPGSQVYLIYSYFLMYAYCALGNLVDVAVKQSRN